MAPSAVSVDRRVPALIVKIGHYPLHHGGVGAIRSLGRIGVPVYAITEDRFTPAAMSRYCTGRFVLPTTGTEDPAQLVDHLISIGCHLAGRDGGRTVAIPTDEEAAVLMAEHAAALSEHFLLPRVPSGLPRQLGSKKGLYELCREHSVPTPASAFPSTVTELKEFAANTRFPVVAKNLEPWVRRRAPVVAGTTVIESAGELLARARAWGEAPSVVLQEYVPREHAEDWIVHLYCGADSGCLALFTGVKVRSWPPHAGMTACAYVVGNPALADLAERFCAKIGFRGVADLDWRLDRRDGQYKLVDFNPRVGAQFRLFETAAGLDVVRALHLDLTGRPVPSGPQIDGRRLVVENIDPPAYLAYRCSGYSVSSKPGRATSTELAWLARDDPLPFLAMSARMAAPVAAHVTQAWRSHAIRKAARPSSGRREGRCPVTTHAATPAVVIGAGPYGLAAAAHLRARDVPVRIFGEAMISWRQHMPAGMCLKSTPAASSLAAPVPGFSLADFCSAAGVATPGENEVVPVELFERYGLWFAERLLPDAEPTAVRLLERDGPRFRLTLATEEEVVTHTVVIATGLTGYWYVPPELETAAPGGPSPERLVSHSSQHRDLSVYAGRQVVVIGAGQSALESAALLHEVGAGVQVLARGGVRFGEPPAASAPGRIHILPQPRTPLGPAWALYPFSHTPGLFRYLPLQTRLALVKTVLGPLGAWWLRDRVVGQFRLATGQRVVRADRDGEQVVLSLVSAEGQCSRVRADHVLAATGYRVNLERLGFLSPALRVSLRCAGGSPRLSDSFESSVPGLFFVGLTAAATFGPVMRFVCGAGFASRRVSAAVTARTART